MLAVTDSTARAGGLAAELKRVEPEGRDSVRVWLDGAAFDVLVKWLVTLSSTHGIQVEGLNGPSVLISVFRDTPLTSSMTMYRPALLLPTS